MATITLNLQGLNEVPEQIKDLKKTLLSYNVELFRLENFVQGIDSNERDLRGAMNGAIGELRASTDAIEEEIAELEKNQQEIEEFTRFSIEKDTAVSFIVIGNESDFYDKYSYLKPESECEKSWLEKVKEAAVSVAEWCKKHWEDIKTVYTLICIVAAVCAIIAINVATFGAATVLLVAIAGAVAAVSMQFASDVISYSISGEWTGTWQSYVGKAVGGVIDGILTFTGLNWLAGYSSSFISTLISESLESLFGNEERTLNEIYLDSFINAGTSIVFDEMFEIAGSSLSKSLSKIPGLSRFYGRDGKMGDLSEDVLEIIFNGFNLDDYVNESIKEAIISIPELITGSIVPSPFTIPFMKAYAN